jgi:tetratricopeptide (TPR) repeat protein
MRTVRNHEVGTGGDPETQARRRRAARGARVALALALVAASVWFGSPHAAAWFHGRGLQAIAAERWDEALREFGRAAWFAPRQPEIRASLLAIHEHLGDHDAAAREAERLSTIDRARAAAWLARRDELLAAERYSRAAEARIARMRAEGWRDDDATADVTRDTAEMLFQIGRYGDAIVVYERLLFKTPTDWTIEEWIQELERRVREGEALTDAPKGPRATGLGGSDEALRIER